MPASKPKLFQVYFSSFLSAVTYKKIKPASLVYSSSMHAPITMMLFDAHKLYCTTRGIHLIKHKYFVMDFQPFFWQILQEYVHPNTWFWQFSDGFISLPSDSWLHPQEHFHILKARPREVLIPVPDFSNLWFSFYCWIISYWVSQEIREFHSPEVRRCQ